jgi:hypothetical protein
VASGFSRTVAIAGPAALLLAAEERIGFLRRRAVSAETNDAIGEDRKAAAAGRGIAGWSGGVTVVAIL